MFKIMLPIFLSLSPLTPSLPFADADNKQIVEDSDFKRLINIINTNIKDNKCAIKIQDSDYTDDFSLSFIKLVIDIYKYYDKQGFKVVLYYTKDPDIIIFSISKFVI